MLKKANMKNNFNKIIEIIIIILLILGFIYLTLILIKPIKVTAKEVITKEDIRLEIINQSIKYNFDVNTALRIAKCESQFNYLAKNKFSSAKGVYQFIDKTWKNYCVGDVFNHQDNIKCFIKLYKKYPNWWICR